MNTARVESHETFQSLPQITSPRAEPTSSRVQNFKRHFKNINFKTLKQRHDNFSFEKTIESRPLIYNSIHFRAIDGDPTKQDVVFFPRQAPTSGTAQTTEELGSFLKRESMSPSALSKVLSEDSFMRSGLPKVVISEHDPEEEERLWGDFKQHFRNTQRPKLNANHHDFILNGRQSHDSLR